MIFFNAFVLTRFNSVSIVFFLFSFIIGCDSEGRTSSTAKINECTLKDKIESDPLTLFSDKDFTVKNIHKEVQDKEETTWSDRTSDEFRFVYNRRKDELLVYKNRNLLKRYSNIKIDGSKTTHVDKVNCTYLNTSDLRLVFFVESISVLQIQNYGMGYYVWYHLDNKTSYSGECEYLNYNH